MPNANATIAVLVLLLGTGCSAILPAHPNSHQSDAERIRITMLEYSDLQNKCVAEAENTELPVPTPAPGAPPPEPAARKHGCLDDYNQAFGLDPNKIGGAEAGGALAAAAVGFAVDYVVKELKKEATEYEAQFRRTVAGDQWWLVEGDDISARYAAIRIERQVGKGKWCAIDESCGDGMKKRAFELVLGLRSSDENQLLQVAPISMQVWRAKTKVLSDKLYTWLLPWTWVGKAIRIPGNQIDVEATTELTSFRNDMDKKTVIAQKVAAIGVKYEGYDISTNKRLTPGEGLEFPEGGWVLGMPRSRSGKKDVGNGAYTVSVQVTERDSSNAKKYLEQAAEYVSGQKETLVNLGKGGE